MRTLRFFTTFAVLLTATSMVFASETAENFARWVPNFASENMNERRSAQQQWQNFAVQRGNDPAIQREIIRVSTEQLARNNPVETTIWIIRQLGIVGDATAVPAVARHLTSNEVRVRNEAARTLALIPGQEAEDALRNDAAQLARDALASRAIIADIPRDDGVETTMPMIIPFLPPGSDTFVAITAVLERYPNMCNMEKAQALSNLSERVLRKHIHQPGSPRSPTLPTILRLAIEAAQSSDETLRNAGILTVGALGEAEHVPFLLEQIQTGANRGLAITALSRMSGQAIDDFLIETLKAEENAERFGLIADVLNRRFNAEIRPLLLERAQAAGTPNRLQLLELAEPTATQADVADFVKIWAMIEDRGQKDRAEHAIARLSQRDAGVVMQALGEWDTPDGMSLLGRVGDTRMLDRIRQAGNAVHAFRNWPNAVVADDLLAITRDTNRSAEARIASLRAFVRVMSLPGNQPNSQIGIRITDVEKVNRLAEAYELATRVDEKRLIIERVGQIRVVESLRFIMQFIDDPELRERTCQSVLDLAHHTGLRRSARPEFNAALDKVLEVTTNDGFRNRATQYRAAQ